MPEFLLVREGIVVSTLLLLNALAFGVYGVDKWSARRGWRRVPEKTLFALALFGGSVGAFLGMRVFRHKTRHWYFAFGIPAIIVAQAALIAFVCFRG